MLTPDQIRDAAISAARSALDNIDLMGVTEMVPATVTSAEVEQIHRLAQNAVVVIRDASEPKPARAVLDLPMPDNDASASTVRDYLIKLLGLVWEHQECFDGKRPYGNSGWEDELFSPLFRAGLVEGTVDTDGYMETVDAPKARQLIADAIQELGKPA